MDDNDRRSSAGSAISVMIALLIIVFLGVAVWAGFDQARGDTPAAESP